jgi:hypothetical protein
MIPSQTDVEAVLSRGAVIKSEFRWHRVGRTNWKAEAWLEETYEGARVKLVGTYNSRTHNLSYTLVWAGCRIRSLDIGGPPHPNPDGALLPTPHKHRWTDKHRDRWAYTPTDILSRGLRGIFYEFLGECNVSMEGDYLDPEEQGVLL